MVLKGKSEQEIANDMAKLPPIDQFCTKFCHSYSKDPNPDRIFDIIQECKPDPRIEWSITKESPAEIVHGRSVHRMYQPNPMYTLEMEFKTIFDTFRRIIEVRYGQWMARAEDSISVRSNERYDT